MAVPVHVLLVEDDDLIASGLVYSLAAEGYTVQRAATVLEAAEQLRIQQFDLAILDLQLPDGDGFQVRELLPAGTAVIFLSVVDDEGNIVRALDGGAEDYITKPFRLRELLARVKVVLRRHQTGSDTISLGRVLIDQGTGRVSIDGRTLELTPLEYRLLLVLANHPGQALTRAQLLDSLWDDAGGFIEDNTLSVYMKRLRRKLGDAVRIETVRGLGYRAQ
jgi:DNA-binding response OmpR family regulator